MIATVTRTIIVFHDNEDEEPPKRGVWAGLRTPKRGFWMPAMGAVLQARSRALPSTSSDAGTEKRVNRRGLHQFHVAASTKLGGAVWGVLIMSALHFRVHTRAPCFLGNSYVAVWCRPGPASVVSFFGLLPGFRQDDTRNYIGRSGCT